MSKFKVGDRVICGDAVKGVVRAFIPETVSYLVEVPELHEWGIYTEEALILRNIKPQDTPKFKRGDKVIATSPDGTSWQGVIRRCASDGYYENNWVVDFPDRNTWGIFDEKHVDTVYPVSPERKYHNIIFVTHDEDKQQVKRKYIFGIENNIKIREGDKLYAQTRYGKKLVTAYCDSFEVNQQALHQLSKIFGGHGTLKYITGRAISGYVEQPF